MKLTWHKTPEEKIVELEDMVKEDVARLDIEVPGRLVFHHVFLTRDHDGPLVFVWGVEGDDAFHCEYVEHTEWATSEIEPDESSST